MGMALTKSRKRLVSCDARLHATPDPKTGKIAPKIDANNVDQTVYPVSAELQREVEDMVRAAHKALGCRGYSLFDIRVDRDSGRPFILECCAFWSFSPISVLSGMLQSAGIDYQRVALDLWRQHALSPTAAEARKCPSIDLSQMLSPAVAATGSK